MTTTDQQGCFKLGDCLVDPGARKVITPFGSRTLTGEQLALLLRLVEQHGEAVSMEALRRHAWPVGGGSDQHLRHRIRALRKILGGMPGDQSYIVDVTGVGYALIAHYEPVAVETTPDAVPTASRTPGGRSLGARLQALAYELRRRSVFKVTGVYLVGMWIVLQVAEVTFEPLHFPDWWLTALTIIAVLGLPVAVVLAWSYEITPEGIVLDPRGTYALKLPRARRAVAPVALVVVVLMAGVTGYAWWHTLRLQFPEATAAPPGLPSVAVLPLVDMSLAGGINNLGDGITEELSARLAQIPGLRVAARTSAFEFRDSNVDVRRIGQSLGVQHVIEGSVRKDGDSLRVTIQLVDASNGYHVWAGSYERAWRDLISIQDDIAMSVINALRVVLAPEPRMAVTSGAPPDVRALDPYLAGLAMLHQSGDMGGIRQAEQHFREAVAIDPTFARAHAALCRVGVLLYDRTRDPADVARAEASCRRALELDRTLLETEKGLAALYLASGRLPDAQTIYRSLVVRYPVDADGHMGLGRVHDEAGRTDDAERSLRAAIRAEPVYWRTHNELGVFLFGRGKVDEAIEAFRRVTELVPASATAQSNLGAALQMKGDLEAAGAAFRRSLEIEPSRGAYSNLGTVYYYLGDFEAAADSYRRATALASQDHNLWGNLGDATWQMPGRQAEALGHYRQAIEHAQRELATSVGQGTPIRAQLAYYCQRVGDVGCADQYLAQSLGAGGDSPWVAYYAALVMAVRGDAAAADTYAKDAVQRGYPAFLVAADPVLRPATPSTSESSR